MQVALPTTNGGLQTRSHTLVVRPGIEQGPEFRLGGWSDLAGWLLAGWAGLGGEGL